MPVSSHPFTLALTRPPLNPPVHSSHTLLPRPFLLPPFLFFAPTSHLHPATLSPVRSTSQPPARTSWINKSGVESHVREFPPRSPWPPTPSMLWPETLSLRITVPPLCKLPPLIFSLSIVTCVILYSFLSGSLSLTLFSLNLHLILILHVTRPPVLWETPRALREERCVPLPPPASPSLLLLLQREMI